MRTLLVTNQFRKDVEILKKKDEDLENLRLVLGKIIEGEPLGERFKDIPFGGTYTHYRLCEVDPQWELLYKRIENTIVFVRTGLESELFKTL